MADTQYNAPLFGISINPSAKNAQLAFTLAQLASVLLVLVGIYLTQRWREKDATSYQPSAVRANVSS